VCTLAMCALRLCPFEHSHPDLITVCVIAVNAWPNIGHGAMANDIMFGNNNNRKVALFTSPELPH
jgi:hypothetical protein